VKEEALPTNGGLAGAGVDALGRAVLDPTKNVLGWVDAAITRQDDLRELQAASAEKFAELRAAHQQQLGDLRAAYEDKLARKESERLDAIRAVDQGNVSRAAEAASNLAATLATQLVSNAEQQRIQVESARVSTEARLIAALEPIQRDVTELRQVQFQQQGERAATNEGKSSNQWTVGTLIAIVSLLMTLTVGAVVISRSPSRSVVVCSGTPLVCR
jgi:hypothetical protein